jgi:hypothetical protein
MYNLIYVYSPDKGQVVKLIENAHDFLWTLETRDRILLSSSKFLYIKANNTLKNIKFKIRLVSYSHLLFSPFERV